MTAPIYIIELVLYIKLVEISPELCIFDVIRSSLKFKEFSLIIISYSQEVVGIC